MECAWGWAARFKASTALGRGKRWLIKGSKSSSWFITNRTDSSCSSTEALYDPNKVFSSTQTAAGSIVASPCTVCANSNTRPPGRTASMADRMRPLPATARIAASAPRPSVCSRTALTVSEREASMFFPKPNVLDIVSLCGYKSEVDRKSTRLNSSHVSISYAVFCLKKKNLRGILESVTAEPDRDEEAIGAAPVPDRRRIRRHVVGARPSASQLGIVHPRTPPRDARA